ncbi:hypothetical protein ElyMa_005230600 [Elysia marginata]|uniref:Uncharacterized protein n=1 Tax=Elysia marginata TaxID=1093978 RepID=A0AAV4JY47_9GAST|nr:hypothetical protein ElyMa_005230600 [Elysia marginata]
MGRLVRGQRQMNEQADRQVNQTQTHRQEAIERFTKSMDVSVNKEMKGSCFERMTIVDLGGADYVNRSEEITEADYVTSTAQHHIVCWDILIPMRAVFST